MWEAIRVGMGKVWRTCLGRKPGVRKGIGLEVMKRVVAQDSEERRGGRRGVKRG